jgi:Predicted glycosyl hydrolase
MNIYVVQKNDTIESISLRFGITTEKLIIDNGLQNANNLVEGQAIVIAVPLQSYVIQDGDSLTSIADAYQITILQLLQNNPQLTGRDYIYPGETITISYDNSKGILTTDGEAFPFINNNTLLQTLPYLTYLTIFNYHVDEKGNITQNFDDTDIIKTAKDYGVSPIMLVTTLSTQGIPNIEIAQSIMLNDTVQDHYIENALYIMKTKGYKGLKITFTFVDSSNLPNYVKFLSKVYNALNPQGYKVFISINPHINIVNGQIKFEELDYSALEPYADYITLISYDWRTYEGPPQPVSIITTPSLLDYITKELPTDKISIAMPTLGYDWSLPYVEGVTKANAINYTAAIDLAVQNNAKISYDEALLTASFRYTASVAANEFQHIVLFKDARSIDASLTILMSYNISNITIWNIMYHFAPMWTVINTQYQIAKVLTSEE